MLVPRSARVLLLGVFVLACARGREPKVVVVFAASSLQGAFGEIERAFEGAHAHTDVQINYAGTQELRVQIEQGARADVLAAADTVHAQALVQAGLLGEPRIFAHNELVIAIRRGLEPTPTGLGALPEVGSIVLGADDVPIGRYTARVLERASSRFGADFAARVAAKVVSREANVKQVLARVTLGEIDAGIVYRSDVAGAASQVDVLEIPPELAVRADYPIAVVTGAPEPELARAFVELVTGAEGGRILDAHGLVAAKAS